jgi:hypothetical protein
MARRYTPRQLELQRTFMTRDTILDKEFRDLDFAVKVAELLGLSRKRALAYYKWRWLLRTPAEALALSEGGPPEVMDWIEHQCRMCYSYKLHMDNIMERLDRHAAWLDRQREAN